MKWKYTTSQYYTKSDWYHKSPDECKRKLQFYSTLIGNAKSICYLICREKNSYITGKSII